MRKIWIILGAILLIIILLIIFRTDCGSQYSGIGENSKCNCKCFGVDFPSRTSHDLEGSSTFNYCYGINLKKYSCDLDSRFYMGDDAKILRNGIYISERTRYIKKYNLLLIPYITNQSIIGDKFFDIGIVCHSDNYNIILQQNTNKKILTGYGTLNFNIDKNIEAGYYLCTINVTSDTNLTYQTEFLLQTY